MKSFTVNLFVFYIIGFVCGAEKFDPKKFDAEKDTFFELYTLENPDEPEIFFKSNWSSISHSKYNVSRATRFFTHGFLNETIHKKMFKDAYLKSGLYDYNVIILDWERSSNINILGYLDAVENVKSIAKLLTEFIEFMVAKNSLHLKYFTMAGHSLGAHMVGLAAKNVKSGKIAKIVGLDPARWGFPIDKPDGRLDKGDAELVEVITTDAFLFGYKEPAIANIAFYVNGGDIQPSCTGDNLFANGCSHSLSVDFYVKSLQIAKAMTGYPCESKKSSKNDVAAYFGGDSLGKSFEGVYCIDL